MSKIDRFYWREISKSYHTFAGEWLKVHNESVGDIISFESSFPDEARSLRLKARKLWQANHKAKPKYDLSEPTQQSLRDDFDISETIIFAEYEQVKRGKHQIGKWRATTGELVSPEEIAANYYRARGWEAFRCERDFISVLYSTFCFSVVQDVRDPLVKIGYRNSTRGWTQTNRNTGMIAIALPEDFGRENHYQRRRAEYDCLFLSLREGSPARLFEEMIAPSENLRDYLWVNSDEAIEIGRKALSIVPPCEIARWVEWVARDFWDRQPGWPDLFLVQEDGYRFVEVKSPKDRLSQSQMLWFRWAIGEGSIPCEVCRIRKTEQEDG